MQQYKSLLKEVLEQGETKTDRTGTGTISVFGVQRKYDLRDGFPLVTIKKTLFNDLGFYPTLSFDVQKSSAFDRLLNCSLIFRI